MIQIISFSSRILASGRLNNAANKISYSGLIRSIQSFIMGVYIYFIGPEVKGWTKYNQGHALYTKVRPGKLVFLVLHVPTLLVGLSCTA